MAMPPSAGAPTSSNPAPATPSRSSSADLINLLRQTTSNSPRPAQQLPQSPSSGSRGAFAAHKAPLPTQNIHGRGVSSSDLVASFMGKPTISSPGAATPSSTQESHSSNPQTQPQDYLLQLLNRTSSSQSKPSAQRHSSFTPFATESSPASARPASALLHGATSSPGQVTSTPPPARRDSPIRQFGSSQSKEPTPFEPDLPTSVAHSPIEKNKENPFTYVNPFEQLVASSPLGRRSGNATPKETSKLSRLASAETKANPKPTTPSLVSSSASTVLNANGHDILQSIETRTPKHIKLEKTDAEALKGIGAPTTDSGTVAQALNEVGDQVSRQVEQALAQGEREDDEGDNEWEDAEMDVEETLRDAAADVKEEIENNGGMKTLETILPVETAKEVKKVIDEAADGDVDGNHSSTDDEGSSGRAEDRIEVPVYNFPMRPFVSLELHEKDLATLQFRQSAITDIARLKKDFDQIDRTLATASNNYIVYAMPKPGGFRVIRQDDGLDRQLFKETKDHIFNVAISTVAPNKKTSSLESCIATASSGKVYWVALSTQGTDNLPGENFEQHCLVFPPAAGHEDNTSGGKLKTRAKKSNRHPNFFAIGRGKTVHIVFPQHAQKSKFVSRDRVVDTAGYLKDRSIKISMGKAGKDFAFSEDDTVVATLDKNGRVRLWDVQDLVNESNGTVSTLFPIEVKTPVLTFATALGNEKSWPTSVMFVDKLKAYSRGTALRYVLVGLKQNHTLQLWDLGLGKAVQEINFPHEKESDAICSIAYHPASGMFVIGHPTRNSIYLIHLSAPKYNLSGISQAKFLERLSSKESALPKPESTAIMSGMREYNFSSNGQIRSIDLLPVSHEALTEKGDPSLFELYVMHSKGVTCLNIRKADLGWSEDMRVVSSRVAEGEGILVVKELRDFVISNASEPSSVNGEAMPTGGSKGRKKNTEATTSKTAEQPPNIPLDPAAPVESAMSGAAASTTEKGRRKKKAGNAASESIPPPAPVPPPATSTSTILAPSPAQQIKESSKAAETKSKRDMTSEQISLNVSPGFMEAEIKKLREALSAEFSIALCRELDELGRKMHDSSVALESAGSKKQEEVLRLVSKSLNDNVEKNLTRIITTQINQMVVPSVHNVTAATVRKELPEWLTKQLLATLPSQLQLALPEAVSKAVQDPKVLNFLSEQITTKVSAYIEKQFSSTLQSTTLASFQQLILDTTAKKIREMEKGLNDQIHVANLRQKEDEKQIENLTRMVEALMDTMHSMASSQAGFQAEILKLHREILRNNQSRRGSEASQQFTPERPMSAQVREIDAIHSTMQAGDVQGAVMQVSIYPFRRYHALLINISGCILIVKSSFSITASCAMTLSF